MNIHEAAKRLRELADLMDLDKPSGGSISIDVYVHSIHTREDLASWVRMMSEPKASHNCGTHWIKSEPELLYVLYDAGLLGKTKTERVVECIIEDAPDIEGLLAEHAHAEREN
ncbi:MAG TPA: hypothetical protein VFH61_15910 [Thermoleophilia bacterium]|nr:hypothetical protein [Thermoleophilia bacterium]